MNLKSDNEWWAIERCIDGVWRPIENDIPSSPAAHARMADLVRDDDTLSSAHVRVATWKSVTEKWDAKIAAAKRLESQARRHAFAREFKARAKPSQGNLLFDGIRDTATGRPMPSTAFVAQDENT